MSHFKQAYPWLQPSWSQLELYIKKSRIPQALLLVGNKGLGKQYLAEQFSKSLMCFFPDVEGDACGKCQSCTLFHAKTHPDYIYIAPEEAGKAIGIDVIRQLIVKLSLKPQFERYRMVVINSADNLNRASANAFLKYLEEPTERTCLVLISDKPFKLPATIRSRCQKLNVSISDKKLVYNWLQQQGVAEDSIALLMRMSCGSPLLAKQFSDQAVIDYREECFDQWVKVMESKQSFILIAEQWYKLSKERLELLLFWLIGWVMDLIKLKSSEQVTDIINIDLISTLQQLAEKLDLKVLYKFYDSLLLKQQLIDTQLNKQLMFEEILIQSASLIKRANH